MDENALAGKVILVVDDENDLRDIVASEFEFMGAKVFQAENITVAKDILSKNEIDLVVSDIRMPGGTGIDLLDNVKAQHVSHPPVLLITGFADITTEDAYGKGAEALMNKPFKLDDLIQTAVRFTRPHEELFSTVPENVTLTLNLNVNKNLEDSISSKEFAFGRGGVAIKIDAKNARTPIGEPVSLQFHFKDKAIKGVGIPRWVKHQDKDSRSVVGFEFVSLDPESQRFLKENTISFIPSLS